MSASSLCVLIIRDVGLRSSLAARLELSGADVVSAREFRDPALERGDTARGRAVLVLDEDVVADEPADWLGVLEDECYWSRIVVLVREPRAPAGSDDRLLYLDRRTASAELATLLPAWRAREAG